MTHATEVGPRPAQSRARPFFLTGILNDFGLKPSFAASKPDKLTKQDSRRDVNEIVRSVLLFCDAAPGEFFSKGKSTMNVSRNQFTLVSAFFFVAVTGCSLFTDYGKLEAAAREHYQARDYDQAVFTCAEALRLNPDYQSAQILIRDAARAAQSAHENRCRELDESTDPFRWDAIVAEYRLLEAVNQCLRELPALRDGETGETIAIEIGDCSEQLNQARVNAAAAHYDEAMRLAASSNDLDVQKRAAKEFKAATEFVSNYKDAAERYEGARKKAIKRVAIIPFEDRSGKAGAYGAIAERIVEKVIDNITNDPEASAYFEIVSLDKLGEIVTIAKETRKDIFDSNTVVEMGQLLGVHEILTGRITQIIYSPPQASSQTVTATEQTWRDVEYTDKKGRRSTRKSQIPLSAEVEVHEKTTSATITGSCRFIDVETAKLKKAESFEGAAAHTARWAIRLGGDEEALTAYRALIGRSQAVPGEQEMINLAINDLTEKLAKALKAYVR